VRSSLQYQPARGDDEALRLALIRLAKQYVRYGYRKIAELLRIDGLTADIPMGRIGTLDDISWAVAWLASAEANYMTGQVISPNGGATIVGI